MISRFTGVSEGTAYVKGLSAKPYALALVLSAVVWLLGWYGETLLTMVGTWWHSETFAHGFLIVPISAWLIWRKRHVIRTLTPRPNYLYLIPLVLVAFGWMLGNLAEVVVVQQYGLVFMVLLLVATILGSAIVKELAFPLLFLLFAVPFGEILLPTLMDHTADFTVLALRFTGIPVYREGLYFTVPSGNWSVVEACSGLRYLIASVTLGALFAYLTYRSFSRRLIFVGLSIIVPIAANWLRAYMIVMIGHLSSMKYAVGVDHLIYGWLFFGVVMLALFWIGSFWREDLDTPEPTPLSATNARVVQPAWANIVIATIVAAGVVAVVPAMVAHLKRVPHTQPTLPAPVGTNKWQAQPGTLSEWVPHYLNASARVSQVYERGDKRVALYVGYYRNQRQNAELIASQNVLVHSGDKVWGSVGSNRRKIVLNGGDFSLIETTIRSHHSRLLVWHWYWVDGEFTTNPYWAKLLEARSQLFGRGDDGAVIVMSTVLDTTVVEAADRLKAFLGDVSPEIAKSLQHAR